MNTTFTISDLYARGWSHFKAHWQLALGAIIIVCGIQLILNIFGYQYDMRTGAESGSIVVSLLALLITIGLSIGITDLFLSMSRGEESSIDQLYKSITVSKFFSYIFASLIYGFMTFLGFILFIIPGIILTLMFYPYFYFIVDQDADAIQALSDARKATKGSRLKILVLLLSLGVLNLLGMIALLVGLLVTIPLTMFIFIELYKSLIGETHVSVDEGLVEKESDVTNVSDAAPKTQEPQDSKTEI